MNREDIEVKATISIEELEENLDQLNTESLIKLIQLAAELLANTNRIGSNEIDFDTEVSVKRKGPDDLDNSERRHIALEYLKERDMLPIQLPANVTPRMKIVQILESLDLLEGHI